VTTSLAPTDLSGALASNAHSLLAYFERRLRFREDAADLLSETMLQAWRRVDALPSGDAAQQRMWLYTIAANVLANHRRTVKRRAALADRLRDHIAASPKGADPSEAVTVRDAVLRLDAAHRELVMLIHWDGFTIAEAAELLGLNRSTARGRYAAARETLKDALTETATR
jgi:RNA polymerase sigma factor (sigma-70 family)